MKICCKGQLLLCILSLVWLGASAHSEEDKQGKEENGKKDAAQEEKDGLPKVIECGKHLYGDPKKVGMNGKSADRNRPVELDIVAPRNGEVFPKDHVKVAVKFRLTNYFLAPNGNHLHLIVDNKPYQAVYNVGEPFYIEVAPGAHMLRAFASRPWHESWKNPEAFSWVRFVVGEDDGKFKYDPAQPLLTYSRPKGTYAIGTTADEVIFDFWTHKIDWQNQRAIAQITDPEGKKIWEKKFSKWESEAIKGKLKKPGKYKVTFSLVDKKTGEVVENGGLNSTQREIEVAEAQPEPQGQPKAEPKGETKAEPKAEPKSEAK